jgi:hypothetical protein
VVIAPPAPKPIEGGTPGPGLLADVVVRKYKDHCPLYRMSQIYERSGVHLAPSTLADWVAAAANLLEPVALVLRDRTLASFVLSLDDTGLRVLDREAPDGAKRGHLWTYIGDGQVLFCSYTPNWEAEGPCAILNLKRGGIIQGDGYAGYGKATVFTGPDPPKRAGCLAHARRKFVVAMQAGDVRATVAVSLIAKLYQIEEQARRDKLDSPTLTERRQTLSKPIMAELHQWVGKLHGTVLPKTPLGKALTYAVRQWAMLELFLEDGRIPIDNNHVERALRPVAVGRKNWLFAGSDEAAKRAAVLMTIIGNCTLNGVPVKDYLVDVIMRLANGWPQSRIAELLPAAWLSEKQRQDADTQKIALN